MYSFPDLKKDTARTRIIIFATDNALSGTETITLNDACSLCKKYNINLYAYCPTSEMNAFATTERIASYKKAVEEKADGKFYTGNLEQMSTSIVNEIKDTKTSLLKSSKKTYATDHPEIVFIVTTIIFFSLIIVEKRTKL